jgi:DNA polymerase-1
MNQNIAFDTETSPIGLRDDPFTGKSEKATSNPVPDLVVMSYAKEGGEIGLLEPEEAARTWLKWIRDDDIRLIGHNVAFDVLVMVRACQELLDEDPLDEVLALCDRMFGAPTEGAVFSDTMYRQKLIDNATTLETKGDERGVSARQYGLVKLEKRHFGRDRSEDKGDDAWRLRYNELRGVPLEDWPEDAREYARDDAEGTLMVWKSQCGSVQIEINGIMHTIVDGESVVDEAFQVASSIHLELLSARGFRLRPEKILDLRDYFHDTIEELEERLYRRDLHDGDSKNMDAIREKMGQAWRDTFGEEPPKTDTGRVSIAKKNRRKLRREGYDAEWMELYAEYTRVEKTHNTFLRPLQAAYPYSLHPGYNAMVATGRTSSFGPNIQNMPAHGKGRAPEIRECFRARDGKVFIGADYSSLELCTLAQACLNFGIDSRLAEAINGGQDCHLLVASQLVDGISGYEEAVSAYENDDHSLHKEVKEARSLAKVVNYGFPGGMGPKKFANEHAPGRGHDVTVSEAYDLRNLWFDTFPGVHKYLKGGEFGTSPVDEHAREGALDQGTQKEVWRVSQHGPNGQTEGWRYRTTASYCAGRNTYFQGLGADGGKEALRRLMNECYRDDESPLHGSHPLAFIHDEFIVEGPRDGATAAAERLSEVMEAGMSVFIPDVDIEAEPELSAYWSKKAEPKRDDDGQLLIYGEDYG